MTEKQIKKSRLISVSDEVRPFVGILEGLRLEELEELKTELRYLETKSYEERVKSRKALVAEN